MFCMSCGAKLEPAPKPEPEPVVVPEPIAVPEPEPEPVPEPGPVAVPAAAPVQVAAPEPEPTVSLPNNTCPTCGAPNDPEDKFCMHCGTKLR